MPSESRYRTSLGADVPLRMHSAIATGFVVHGELGPHEGGQTVLGDTVNVAARLTSQAGPGEIVVSETTYELTSGQFDFEYLGPVKIRGREEPVVGYRVVGTRSEPVSVRRTTGLRSEFVGRRRELIRLHAAVGAVLDGRPETISIVGGPGVGKSRLVEEFRRSIATLNLTWRVAQCHQHSQHVPYAALKDFLARIWEVGAQPTPSRIREALEKHVRPVASEEAMARLGRLWGLDHPLLSGVDPEAWRSGLLDDVLALVQGLASRGPSVMLFEDIHWADRQSLDVLAYVLEKGATPRADTLHVTKPQRAGIDRAFSGGSADRVMQLADLGPDESVRMCGSLLQCRELPEELERFVRTELGGNPFYIEEMVNSLGGQRCAHSGRRLLARRQPAQQRRRSVDRDRGRRGARRPALAAHEAHRAGGVADRAHLFAGGAARREPVSRRGR